MHPTHPRARRRRKDLPAGRRTAAVLTAVLTAAASLALAAPAQADPRGNAPEHAHDRAGWPERHDRHHRSLPDRVTGRRIEGHMANLATIARYNGGNRASGTPGYDVAALYVENQLERAGYEPYRDTYEYTAWEELSDAVLSRSGSGPVDYEVGTDYISMAYSAAGDVTAPAVAVDADSGDSGCTSEDFAGFPEGAIAITVRGACPFALKTQNAADAGAAAVLVVNSADEVFSGTVSTPSEIPVLGVSGAAGAPLLAAGEGLELRVMVDSLTETRESFNVIAETEGGSGDNVVVAGGHLDSVEEGAGANDNGSGVAFLLESAIQLARQGEPNNKVRFAFWGTEESGLVGSTEYVEGLSAEQVDDIALYLNFDMIGSHNYARFVLDGGMELPGSGQAPSGSGAIAQVFAEYFEDRGQVSEPGVLSGRSDYAPFAQAGIPVGGLFSGADGVKTEEQAEWYGGVAGETFDPYYHTAEDTLANVNRDSLDELSDAGAHGIEFFAESTLPVNGVLRRAAGPEFARLGQEWLR
ncbi:M20/M25/M40 family metallo-hydrolase [Nocardiopsis sp. CNT312]|uniref:M20/M25/M40 family metallo-hydrolase n=1 Tax=Nocardiopsis sp. CNT312 TaxID=1137268 RepID=UPI000688453C|nr:M20/M25/M40 family metallo-hydrolase [Nocardiopsis sp. CNT312]